MNDVDRKLYGNFREGDIKGGFGHREAQEAPKPGWVRGYVQVPNGYSASEVDLKIDGKKVSIGHDGSFTSEKFAAGTYSWEARLNDKTTTSSGSVTIKANEQAYLDIKIDELQGTLSLRMRDRLGRALSNTGGEFELKRTDLGRNDAITFKHESWSDGSLAQAAGDYELLYRGSDDYFPAPKQTFSIPGNESHVATFYLQRKEVNGRAFLPAGYSFSVAQGLTLTVFDQNNREVRKVSPWSSGEYKVLGLNNGSYRFQLSGDYINTGSQTVNISNRTVDGVDFRPTLKDARAKVEIEVPGDEDFDGGRVRLKYNGRTWGDYAYSGQARYDLGVVNPGEVSVQLIDRNGKVVGSGYEYVLPGEDKTVRATVSKTLASYRGVVKDQFDNPINKATVSVNGKSGQTDARGQFVIAGVKPTKTIQVKVNETDYTYELNMTVPVNRTDGGKTYDLPGALKPDFKTKQLRLQFNDADTGNGVGGVTWEVTPNPNKRAENAESRKGTTKDGGYVEQVLYPGTYDLKLTSPKGDVGDKYTFVNPPQQIDVQPRGESQPITITARKNPGEVMGRVLDDAGNPVANALVRVGRETTRTNNDGKYTFTGVPAGTSSVSVDKASDGSYEEVSKTFPTLDAAERKDVGDITVDRATSRIEGTVRIEGEPAQGGVSVVVRSQDGRYVDYGGVENGKFSFTNTSSAKLLPGEYDVTVLNPGDGRFDETKKTVTVKPGQTATVEFDLKENRAPIVATVLNEAGEPVSGAKLTITGVNTTWTEGESGVYTSGNLPAGEYLLKVEASDNHGSAPGKVEVKWATGGKVIFTVTRDPGTVTINVTDDVGQPVSGVKAKLDGYQSDGDKTPFTKELTITDGKVVFDKVPVGTYKVTIADSSAYENPANAKSVEFTVGAAEKVARDVKLRRKDGAMTVHVMDETSRAINKPVIKLIDENGAETTAVGDKDGMHVFDKLRPGTYKIEVEPTDRYKGGFESGITIAPGSTAAANLAFVRVTRETVTVTGIVVDETGQPVAGATVLAESGGTQEVITDEDGRFVVEGLKEGYATFKVRRKIGEYTGNTLTVNDLLAGNKYDIKIAITRDLKRLNGSVLDDGGKAIEGVEAQLIQDGAVVKTQNTDRDGSFAFDRMEPGTYTVKVAETETHLGNESESFEVVLGHGTDPVQVVLQRKPGSLTGKVTFSNDKVVEGAGVRLVPDSGEPLELDFSNGGEINVPELPAGTYKVEVTSPENYKRVSLPPLTVHPAEKADLGTIQFIAEIGEVAGTVRDENGDPVGDVKIKLNFPGQQPIEATSAEDGTFSFAQVPVGEYTVDVVQPEKFKSISGLKTSVDAAKTSNLDITLKAKPTKGTVSGKVEDEDGNPVVNVGIALEPTSGKGDTIDVKVAEDGTFDDANIPAGSYTLKVTQPVGYEDVDNIPVKVEAGKVRKVDTITLKKSDVQAETGNLIGGVYDKKTNAPLPQTGLVLVRGEARYPVAINADGTFRRNGLPTGEYLLRVAQPEGYVEPRAITVVIEPGLDNYVQDIKLERVPVETTPTTGALEGNVLGLSEGKPVDPISGAKVNILRLGGTSTQVTTNASGIFTAVGLEPGEYVVQVEAPEGYNKPRYERVVVEAGKSTDDVRIYLNRKPTPNPKPGAAPGTISGWLLDDGNYPIKGGTIHITGTDKHKDGSPRLDENGKPIETLPAVKIGKDGYFTTDRLEPGDYTIDINVPEGWTKPKGWPKKVTVTEDKAIELGVVTVQAPRSNVEGVVDDGKGNPIEGVIVTATDSRGKTTEVATDKNGKFVFDQALPGTTTIEVFTPQGIQNVDPMYVPVKPGENAAIPGVHLTEKQLKLSKRIRGYDADDLDNAPILPEDWDLVYGFLITNETNEVITDITLDDPFLGDTKVVKPKDFKGTLAPGEHVYFSAVMPPQKNMPIVNNIATVHGKNGKGQMVASTPNNAVARIGSASVEKKVNARFGVDKDKPVSLDVDEDMYFTYEIMNRGSAPMYNVTLTDEVCEWKDGANEAEASDCKPMEIDLPSDWNRTLLPGERVFLTAALPPLKPGTRHHNKALVKADLDQPRRSPGIKEEEGIFEEDPPSILTVTPNKNSWGNAHVIVSEGKAPKGYIDGVLSGLPAGLLTEAKVELISEDNKTSLSANVDSNGKFAYGNVTPGKYKLRVTNPSDDAMKIVGELGIPTEQGAKGQKITTKLFNVEPEKPTKLNIELAKVGAPNEGSSLGRCITETSSASNPAMYLIPLGLLIGAMAGSLVIYEDQFNAVVKQFNQAMPQLAIERPAWMNQISRQLEQLHPAAGPAVLAVMLVAVGAIAVGLAYAACESGVDRSSKGNGSSKKEETPAKETEKVS
ncbi:carboxypeptidase regulatory-like domain-containing protein [Corynebacterium sp. NML130628]|uniref:carboxypeptidase regulatory-like domain-containing protein n=1 Tax=Corynebacterium sp. NML130628 TaxID=1906333 RepID=UPI0015A6F6FF|nr:carboxypeptidase regulatory-like domain-containing protein [Corynebacterium sp. NML130628]